MATGKNSTVRDYRDTTDQAQCINIQSPLKKQRSYGYVMTGKSRSYLTDIRQVQPN